MDKYATKRENVKRERLGTIAFNPTLKDPTTDLSKRIYNLEDFEQRILEICQHIYEVFGSQNLEGTYQRALKIDLEKLGVKVISEVDIPLTYRNEQVGTRRIDLVCEMPNNERVLVELKAVRSAFTLEHKRQLQYYMEKSGVRVGFLVNFPHKSGLACTLDFAHYSLNSDITNSDVDVVHQPFVVVALDKANNRDSSLDDTIDKVEIMKIVEVQSNDEMSLLEIAFKEVTIDTNDSLKVYGQTLKGATCIRCKNTESGFCNMHKDNCKQCGKAKNNCGCSVVIQ